MTYPRVVVADTFVGAEELVGLPAHARGVYSRQPAVPCHQLLGTQPTSTTKRAQLSNLGAIPGDVVDLPRLDGVHHRGGVIPEFALSDDLHDNSVAR